MKLEEHIYSVLIVSSSEKFNTTFKEMLPTRDFDPIHIVSSVYQAQMRIAERQYDIIIINSPLFDESGIEFSIDSGSSNNTVTLLIVRNELYDDVYSKVVKYGTFVMRKPFSMQVVMQSVNDIKSARERLRRLEKKPVSLEERMAEILQEAADILNENSGKPSIKFIIDDNRFNKEDIDFFKKCIAKAESKIDKKVCEEIRNRARELYDEYNNPKNAKFIEHLEKYFIERIYLQDETIQLSDLSYYAKLGNGSFST